MSSMRFSFLGRLIQIILASSLASGWQQEGRSSIIKPPVVNPHLVPLIPSNHVQQAHAPVGGINLGQLFMDLQLWSIIYSDMNSRERLDEALAEGIRNLSPGEEQMYVSVWNHSEFIRLVPVLPDETILVNGTHTSTHNLVGLDRQQLFGSNNIGFATTCIEDKISSCLKALDRAGIKAVADKSTGSIAVISTDERLGEVKFIRNVKGEQRSLTFHSEDEPDMEHGLHISWGESGRISV